MVRKAGTYTPHSYMYVLFCAANEEGFLYGMLQKVLVFCAALWYTESIAMYRRTNKRADDAWKRNAFRLALRILQ